jgi:hypothetical protein
MGLSALQIERAKAGAKLYRLFDGEGLFIEITPTGAKRWRVKYFSYGPLLVNKQIDAHRGCHDPDLLTNE